MKKKSSSKKDDCVVPLLPLRDVVVYPHMVIPLFVGRSKSIAALDAAMSGDKQIFLVAQKSAADDDPDIEQIYEVGSLSNILQLLKLPDGTIKVLVEGVKRARLIDLMETDSMFVARAAALETEGLDNEEEVDILSRSAMAQFEQYVKLHKKLPSELLSSLAGLDDPSRLADTIAAHTSVKLEEKQLMLEQVNVRERLERLIQLLEKEIGLMQTEKRIRGRVKSQMEKSQREYYLNEQMKAIQKELGDMEEAPNEMEELARKIAKSGMPKETKKRAEAELNKLKMMPPMSAEATVVRNYVDWLVNVP